MSTKSTKGNNVGKNVGKKDCFLISGKAFWAHLAEVNKLSDKFQIDISVDKDTAKILEEKGIEAHENEKDDEGRPENHRGLYVTARSAYPPKIYDSKRKEIHKKVLIGNGSDINACVHIYEWKFGKQSGLSLGLDAVQLINVIEYSDPTADIFEECDGYIDSSDNSDFDSNDSVSEYPKSKHSISDNPF